jgi:hypothetical protein
MKTSVKGARGSRASELQGACTGKPRRRLCLARDDNCGGSGAMELVARRESQCLLGSVPSRRLLASWIHLVRAVYWLGGLRLHRADSWQNPIVSARA